MSCGLRTVGTESIGHHERGAERRRHDVRVGRCGFELPPNRGDLRQQVRARLRIHGRGMVVVGDRPLDAGQQLEQVAAHIGKEAEPILELADATQPLGRLFLPLYGRRCSTWWPARGTPPRP